MKFLFYGASVTKQGGSSGYIQSLKALAEGTTVEITSIAYGACHFNDAGFYNIKKVISEYPDVCVLEWNTTGLSEFDVKKMDSVLGELIENNISIAFLILPRRDTNLKKNRKAEELIFKLSESFDIPLLDLRMSVAFDDCVRDDVHTNDFGAFTYANNIHSWIKNTVFNKTINDFKVLKSVYTKEVEFFVGANSVIECDLKYSTSDFFEIVFEITVGPSLLNLLISIDTHQIEKSFVDPWCYYERKMFHTVCQEKNFKHFVNPSKLMIRASENLPDFTPLLKTPKIPLNEFKGVLVHNIYSLGIELYNLKINNL